MTADSQAALFEVDGQGHALEAAVFSVHCFFNCGHVTRAGDPYTSSAAMEEHYTEQHTADIDRALGFVGVSRRSAA